MELEIRDEEGTVLFSASLGKEEGEWNPESPDEMQMLLSKIEEAYALYKPE